MKTFNLFDKNKTSYTCHCFYGLEIAQHISEVAQFRLKYFREFPYLYEGSDIDEEKYLRGFCEDPKSLLVLLKKSDNETIAISTSLPLVTNSAILEGVPEIFVS